jgi:nitrate/nitrite transporter NarK
MWLSARWGGAFTPLLVVWVFSVLSWRRAFELFGALGILWAIWFYRWFRDNPRDHKSVNAAELAELQGAEANLAGHPRVPWARLLRSRTVLLLWLQYFCFAYGWYFYITWLPTYLQEARGLTLTKSAFLAGFPLFFGGLASLLSGTLAARLASRLGDMGRLRRWIAYVGFSGSAVMVLLSVYIKDATLGMIAMGLASFALDLTLPGSWGACMDVGGKYAGTLSGSMNMMGNLAGGLAPIVVGYVLQHSDRNWILTFWISAAVYLLGALCWVGIDPVTPLEEKPEEAVDTKPRADS